MKLRSYLRGLGIGIIVTAIILHFSLKTANGAAMTDSEIKARAAELGMIENTVLSNTVSQGSVSLNLSGDEDRSDTFDTSEEGSVSEVIDIALQGDDETVAGPDDTLSGNETEVTDDGTEVSDDTEDSEPADTPDETVTETPDDSDTEVTTPVDAPVNYVTITVVAGDSSYSVAKKVYDAGLVTSAALFDEFLCAGGYDRTISIGQHRVPVDATDEEIAKILTSGD